MPTPDTATAKPANPFAALAVQDGDHAEDLVDVALHEPARRALDRGRSRVRSGRPHVAALIGDAGAGKSHLLWWLRRQNSATHGLFVQLQALPDLAQPFRHALRQLVSALCKKGPNSDASSPFERPIDRLLWELIYLQTLDLLDAARISMYQGPAALLKLVGPLALEGGRRRPVAEFAKAAQEVWPQVEPGLRAYLLSLPTEAAIDSAARAVLIQYPYLDRRSLVTAWLAGEELGPKEREKLAAKQVINNESAAKYVLCALCRLMTANPGQSQGAPLIVAYDQTDQVAEQLGHPGVHAIAEVIAAIQLQGGSVLQVLSCRPESWKLLHQKHDRTGSSQLKHIDDTLHLGAVEAQHLRELIQARAGTMSKLTAGDLDPQSWPGQFATPREALAHFARRQEPALFEAVPLPATDAPTAKGLPSEPLRSTAKGPAASVAAAKSPTATASAKKDAPSRPGAAATVAKKDAPSVAAKPSKDAPSRPAAAPAKPEPAKPAAPPPAAAAPPPSSQSPSVAWLVMASDDDPLTAALAKLDAEPAAQPSPAATTASAPKAVAKPVAAAPAKPVPVAPAKPVASAPAKISAPAPTPAPAKKVAPAATAGRGSAAPAPSATSPSLGWLSRGDDAKAPAAAAPKSPAPAAKQPAMQPMAAPPPSAQSPSVTWMAMASDDDPLAQALAAAEREDAAAAAAAAQPSRPPRTTKERLPAVESRPESRLSAAQVLSAIGRRERIEEWLLARELGVTVAGLAAALAQLEDQGAIRLLTIGDGQRTIARLGR